MPGQGAAAAARTVAPAAAGELVDASWDDVIRAISKQHGVNPALALAVAKKESNRTPGAVGDGGKAIGMFQLHAGAAADTGVDRNDPIQNITGGVKYLKTLSDRYQGDLNKTLMAYNGGMANVDKGSVSPEAQAYAAEVMATLSSGMLEVAKGKVGPPAPAAGRGTSATNIGTEAKANAYALGQGFDPRTPTGRNNIASTVGSVGTALLTRGLPVTGLMTKVAQVLAPAIGAAVGGAGERALEESAGSVEPGGVTRTGITQGLMDLGGQAIMWPLRRFGRELIAGRVARKAEAGLKAETVATQREGQAAVQQVVNEVRLAKDMLQASTRAAVRTTRREGIAAVRGVEAAAAQNLADAELKAAAELTTAKKAYDDLLQYVPGQIAGGQQVKQVLTGPAKRALDLAGQRVSEAAEHGPDIPLAPIREALNEMVGQHRPSVMFPSAVPAPTGGTIAIGARPQGIPAGGRMSVEDYKKFVAGKLGLPETHPLPGLLGKIEAIDPAQTAISFKEAHQIKMLLDEAVNWDRVAKKHLEKITKGLRTGLREEMRGNADYDAATAAYQAMVPLYRKGIGQRMIKLANTPDGVSKLATSLHSADAAQAMVMKQLLVDQAAAGGDALAGQRAWNAVRAQYTFDKIIAGGADGLGTRVDELTTLSPEFTRVVYGDSSGQNVLMRLTAIAEAVKHAKASGAEQLADTAAAGNASRLAAKDAATDANANVKDRVKDALVRATRTGQSRVAVAKQAAEEANQAQVLKNAKFVGSTVHPYAKRTLLTQSADVMVAGAAGIHSLWGVRAMLRLLNSPRSADLIEWAAYSPRGTRIVVDMLTKPGITPQAGAAAMREIGTAFGLNPMPSHKVAPPPAAQPRQP